MIAREYNPKNILLFKEFSSKKERGPLGGDNLITIYTITQQIRVLACH